MPGMFRYRLAGGWIDIAVASLPVILHRFQKPSSHRGQFLYAALNGGTL
jgi:hypothetical protein